MERGGEGSRGGEWRGGEGKATPYYDRPYVEASPRRGSFFRVRGTEKGIEILRVEVELCFRMGLRECLKNIHSCYYLATQTA